MTDYLKMTKKNKSSKAQQYLTVPLKTADFCSVFVNFPCISNLLHVKKDVTYLRHSRLLSHI